MSYIVFDLEWNQCPYGKEKEVAELPFEILEIGAVKLNEELQIIDEFHQIIKPVVYTKIHFRTREIIQMSDQELEAGKLFHEAVEDFFVWCGPDPDYCTWGSLDLMELQRNMRYYELLDMINGPVPYFDIQKIFGIQFENKKTSRSLEWAVDSLKIPKQREFHRALDDAFYTALVMQQLDRDTLEAYYSIDCYQNPKSKKEEIEVVYPSYYKYISREFDSKEEAMKDRKILSTRCYICRRNAKKRIRWFSVGSKNHICVSYCMKHGFLKGKIRIKKTEDGKYYVVKTLKLISEEEAMKIQAKQEMLRLKRQLKRRKEKKG